MAQWLDTGTYTLNADVLLVSSLTKSTGAISDAEKKVQRDRIRAETFA
jgi:hypothetical protein